MLIEILRLLSFEGPNIVNPSPGVLLDARAEGDIAAGLRNALKDAGQQVGIVIGQLAVEWEPEVRSQPLGVTNSALHSVAPLGESTAHTTRLSFTTPTPALGAEIVRYAIAGLNAFAAGDNEWDGEEQLWVLQQRRRHEALPFGAIQCIAEAQRRNIPAFRRSDGRLQLGYGVRGAAFELAQFADAVPATPPAVPWAQLGRIPIIAVSGKMQEPADLAQFAKSFGVAYQHVGIQQQADFATARALLCQPGLAVAVIELTAESLLAHGLPFDSCDESIIGVVPTALGVAFNRSELARAIALPLLVTASTGHATLANDPLLRELAGYAACEVRFPD